MRAFAMGDHNGFLLCEMIYTRAPAPLFMRLTLSPFYVYYGEWDWLPAHVGINSPFRRSLSISSWLLASSFVFVLGFLFTSLYIFQKTFFGLEFRFLVPGSSLFRAKMDKKNGNHLLRRTTFLQCLYNKAFMAPYRGWGPVVPLHR